MEVIVWLIVAAVLIIIELLTLGLTSIWFAGGALVAAICAQLGASSNVQFLVFIVVSVILLLFTRPIAAKHLNSKTVKTNIDVLVGKTCRVIADIDNGKEEGRVMINGIPWSARSVNDQELIAKDTTVTIREIAGVKVIVEELKED